METTTTTDEKWPAVMLDIETLGTGDDAVILEIAAVCFDREGGRWGPEWSLVVDHVAQHGRRVCAETLQWWLADERVATLRELTDRSETKPLLWHGLMELSKFLAEALERDGEVWAKGDFDLRILGHACAGTGVAVPWKYYQARELRTVLKLAGIYDTKPTGHRALADARRQVELLWQAGTEKQQLRAVLQNVGNILRGCGLHGEFYDSPEKAAEGVRVIVQSLRAELRQREVESGIRDMIDDLPKYQQAIVSWSLSMNDQVEQPPGSGTPQTHKPI